ncbi:MAG: hypothetical protein K2Q26_06650 [Bdellovibrionales bacterium]|nr:hypothetical protein [Bdellovibrionales bacterium]
MHEVNVAGMTCQILKKVDPNAKIAVDLSKGIVSVETIVSEVQVFLETF